MILQIVLVALCCWRQANTRNRPDPVPAQARCSCSVLHQGHWKGNTDLPVVAESNVTMPTCVSPSSHIPP
jgi:hypothetical protein